MRRSITALVWLAAVSVGVAELRNGMTREELESELGPPSGEMMIRGRLNLMYDGGIVELVSNRVVSFERNFQRRAAQRAEERAFEQSQIAKGLVKYEGQWLTADEAEERAQKAKAAKAYEAERTRQAQQRPRASAPALSNEDRVRTIRQGGRRIDVTEMLVQDKITIVDFFADWCGPCRAMGPRLLNVARADPEVCLCKVDIVDWNSDVVSQYELSSIPNVRVFNRAGQMVGMPTSDLNKVIEYVAQAH